MTTPAPAPASSHEGFLGHVRDWFAKDVEPRILAAEADLGKVKGLGPEVQALAGIVEKIAEAADPSAAPEIAALAAGAGKVAARIGEIVASLEAGGL
jgi:phage-related tail protein